MSLRLSIFWFSIIIALNSLGQSCNPNSLLRIEVKATNTDANIPWELNNHWVYFNPDCTPKQKLLVYIVGSYGSPKHDTLLPYYAAMNGFHAVSIEYPNDYTVASQCTNESDPNCYGKLRYEQCFGADSLSIIDMDTTNCIEHRTLKLLQYLEANYPTHNWQQFYTGNNINWQMVTVAGHSQGGGNAAFIGKYRSVERVIMFSSVSDYSLHFFQSAPWIAQPGLTSGNNYYGFTNTNDELTGINRFTAHWSSMGMGPVTDTVHTSVGCNYNGSHMIYTDTNLTSGAYVNHGSTITQTSTPIDANNTPLFLNVWYYLLGLDCTQNAGITDFKLEYSALNFYPNPSNGLVYIQNNQKLPIQFITVYGLSGQIVKSFSNTSEPFLNLSDLDKGPYAIQTTLSNGQIYVNKLILE